MIEMKPNQNYINEKPLETIIKPNYDTHDDLKIARHNLDWSFDAKGPQTFFKTTPEEEAAKVDSWYQGRLGEIATEEQAYRQRLANAEKSGAIDSSEANKLLMDLHFPTNPFQKARREASETYHKERKF